MADETTFTGGANVGGSASSATDGGGPAAGVGASPAPAASSNGHAETFQPAQSVPPQSWSREYHQHWSAIPEPARQYISQREREAHQAITSYGDRVKKYEPYDRIAAEHAEHFQRYGITPDQALAEHLRVHAYLDRDPAGFIREVAQRYGIDIEASQAQAQELARTRQELIQQQQSIEQQQQEEANTTLQEFAKGRPHFQAVRKLMASFYRDGHAETLQQAYDLAVAASGLDRAAAEEKRLAEARRKAADAQKCARLNVRSSSHAWRAPLSSQDTIRAIATKHYG